MVSIHWLEKRKPHWERLEQLVQRSRGGLAALNHQELQELGLLYRQTAAHGFCRSSSKMESGVITRWQLT